MTRARGTGCAACCAEVPQIFDLDEVSSSAVHLLLVFGVGLTLPYWVDVRRTVRRVLRLGVTFILALRYMWWRGTQTLAPTGLTLGKLVAVRVRVSGHGRLYQCACDPVAPAQRCG